MSTVLHVTDSAFMHPDIPADVEAGAYVSGVLHATAALSDAMSDEDIRASLTGLDAESLERAAERILMIVEEIDNG